MNDFFKGDDNFVGTKGLVFIGDDILIYRRDAKAPIYPFYLDVPGGAAELGEAPFDTFKREIKEEFGLEITAKQVVYNRRYQSSVNENEFGWYAVAKLPKDASSLIKFGDEGLEYLLMPLDEFLQRTDVWPAYQK